MAFYAKREKSANREMREGEKMFSSPSSRASGKMPRSPRLVHKAPVMKSSVHRLVFIVFNYNFSAFLLQKFSVQANAQLLMLGNFYDALLVLYGLDKRSFTAKLKKENRFEE